MSVGDISDQAEIQEDKLQVFSSNDDRLKALGEVFSNESSRKIIDLLLEKEMTIMQISKESGLSANLIMHHLKKMIVSQLVIVTRESKNSRGHTLRFYRAKQAILILAKDLAKNTHANKSLQKTLNKIARFCAIAIAGMFAWLATSPQLYLESAFKYPRPTLPPYMTPIEPQAGDVLTLPILVAVGIVLVGIGINHYLPKIIRRKTTSPV